MPIARLVAFYCRASGTLFCIVLPEMAHHCPGAGTLSFQQWHWRIMVQNNIIHPSKWHFCTSISPQFEMHIIIWHVNWHGMGDFLNFVQVVLMKYFLPAGRFLFLSSQYLVVNITWWCYQLLIHSFTRDIEGVGYLASWQGSHWHCVELAFHWSKDYHDNRLTSPTVNTS